MTDNNTTDMNKRIADLLSELFLKAAEDAADKTCIGQDSLEELITTNVAEAVAINKFITSDDVDNKVEEVARDVIADAVEEAVNDKIGYSEVITEDNFNDWLEDSEALSYLAREDYVEDSIMHAINEMESDFVSLETVNQMMRDLETDIEAAKLSNRIKLRVERLFTLTRRRIKSLLSFRVSFGQVEG